MIPDKVIDEILTVVGKGETREAIELLKSNLSKTDSMYADVVALEGEASELNKEKIKGIINNENADLRSNRIRHDLLALIFGKESQLSKELRRSRLKERVKQKQEDDQYEKDKIAFWRNISALPETISMVSELFESIPDRAIELGKELNAEVKYINFDTRNSSLAFDFGNIASIYTTRRQTSINASTNHTLIFYLYNKPRESFDTYIWEKTAKTIKIIKFDLTINRNKELRWQDTEGRLYTFDDLNEVIFELIAEGLLIKKER